MNWIRLLECDICHTSAPFIEAHFSWRWEQPKFEFFFQTLGDSFVLVIFWRIGAHCVFKYSSKTSKIGQLELMYYGWIPNILLTSLLRRTYIGKIKRLIWYWFLLSLNVAILMIFFSSYTRRSSLRFAQSLGHARWNCYPSCGRIKLASGLWGFFLQLVFLEKKEYKNKIFCWVTALSLDANIFSLQSDVWKIYSYYLDTRPRLMSLKHKTESTS